MTKQSRLITLLSAIAFIFATGCAKKEQNATTAESSQSAEAASNGSAQTSTISKPDPSVANSAYREMKYATDSLYAYYALYPKEPQLGIIAKAITKKYDQEVDGFKKQEIVAGLKDEMTSGIAKAKENKYYFVNVKANEMDIRPYDFEKKSFFNPRLGVSTDPVRSYSVPKFTFPSAEGDNMVGADVRFSNAKQFADVKVEDNEAARKMEGLRASDKLGMKVYFYANDILPDREDYQQLSPEITRIEYLDPAGNVVFTQLK